MQCRCTLYLAAASGRTIHEAGMLMQVNLKVEVEGCQRGSQLNRRQELADSLTEEEESMAQHVH